MHGRCHEEQVVAHLKEVATCGDPPQNQVPGGNCGLWGWAHTGRSFLVRMMNLWESHSWARVGGVWRCVEQGAAEGSCLWTDNKSYSSTLCTSEQKDIIGIRNGKWSWAWEKERKMASLKKSKQNHKIHQSYSDSIIRYYLIQCIKPMFIEIKLILNNPNNILPSSPLKVVLRFSYSYE